jgi:hypothetical protein
MTLILWAATPTRLVSAAPVPMIDVSSCAFGRGLQDA